MNSIKFRLTALFLVSIFSCVAATGLFFSSYFQRHYINNLKQKLIEQGHIIEVLINNTKKDRYQEIVKSVAGRIGGREVIRITIIGPDGLVLADSESDPAQMDNHLGRPEIRQASDSGMGSSERLSDTVKREFLYVAQKIDSSTGNHLFIRTAAPSRSINETVNHIKYTIFIATAATLAFALVITLLITSRFTGPVSKLQQTSEKIADGDLDARSSIRSNDEFGQLSRAIDTMADSIQSNIDHLNQRRAEIENILRSMQDGVIVIDTDRRILIMNDAVFQVFDIKQDDYTGKRLINVIRHSSIIDAIEKVLAEDADAELEIELHPISRITVNVRIFPFRNRSGMLTGAILVVRDISRIRKLETVRSDFIENVSHELRTPIALISGIVETLMTGAMEDPDAADRFLRMLNKESSRLMQLTEDIITLEKAEKIQFISKSEKIDICAELADYFKTYELLIKKDNLKLRTEFPREQVFLEMPREDFRHIFANLIDNAIKFTDEGEVSVAVTPGAGNVRITVRDTGPGIPPRDRERIFERFYRVDKSRSREKGGTGLGLSIVKHLVERRRGSIRVESKPGSGSSFIVTFPTGQMDTNNAPEDSPAT